MFRKHILHLINSEFYLKYAKNYIHLCEIFTELIEKEECAISHRFDDELFLNYITVQL